MGGDELAGAFALVGGAEEADALAAEVVDGDAVAHVGGIVDSAHAIEFADEEVALVVEADAVGAVDIVPHGDVLAVGIEDLDAVGLTVGDVDAVVAVDDDVVGADELAGVDTGLAPREDVASVGGILVDAGVAVAVGDVDVAGLGRDGAVSGAVEGLASPLGGWLVIGAEGHEELAVGVVFADDVQAVVDAEDGVVGGDVDAVGTGAELAFAPSAQEVAVAVEDDDGVLAAVEEVDIVLGVDGDTGDIDEAPVVGDLGPVVDELKSQGAGTYGGGHGGGLLQMCFRAPVL